MNPDRIDRVIASIKGEITRTKNIGFQMADFLQSNEILDQDMSGRNCGTVACIAGHAFVLSGGGKVHDSRLDIVDRAQRYLDLSNEETNLLFYGNYVNRMGHSNQVRLSDVTPEQAIAVLEHFKTTGKVDWFIIFDMA